MNRNNLIEKYLDIVQKMGISSYSKEDMRFYLNYLFQDMSFTGKSMLDIGGGSGLFSVYGAVMGAKEVICLEPELEGSTKGISNNIKQLSTNLSLKNITLLRKRFQNFDSEYRTFDIILLHDSINHLNEEACIKLQYDNEARNKYKSICKNMYELGASGAKLVITDCSPHNFFALLGITNPFAPTIEWHKHQPPEYWRNMLTDKGFINPRIRWTSPNFLRKMGRYIFGNRAASYFLASHFCLTMEKHR